MCSGNPYHLGVSLHLYDTATRSMREFHPARKPTASIYVCGATVQGVPHIGHVAQRAELRRAAPLAHDGGSDVLFVRNVTDIDDKILTKAAEARPAVVGVGGDARARLRGRLRRARLPARRRYAPRATGHVTQMVELMQRLIDTGHAYAAGGDVYFSVRSFPQYGVLSGQRPDEVQQGEARCRRQARPAGLHAVEGARSRASRPGRRRGVPAVPAGTSSARRWPLTYLGAEFDIHGGGHRPDFPAPRERAGAVTRGW